MTRGTYESTIVNSFLKKFYYYSKCGTVAQLWEQSLALASFLKTNEYEFIVV